jgi:hypothetical protein
VVTGFPDSCSSVQFVSRLRHPCPSVQSVSNHLISSPLRMKIRSKRLPFDPLSRASALKKSRFHRFRATAPQMALVCLGFAHQRPKKLSFAPLSRASSQKKSRLSRVGAKSPPKSPVLDAYFAWPTGMDRLHLTGVRA